MECESVPTKPLLHSTPKSCCGGLQTLQNHCHCLFFVSLLNNPSYLCLHIKAVLQSNGYIFLIWPKKRVMLYVYSPCPSPPKTLHSLWGFVASKIGWLIALQFSWIASMEKLWKRSKKFSPLTLQKKKNQLIDSECLREEHLYPNYNKLCFE